MYFFICMVMIFILLASFVIGYLRIMGIFAVILGIILVVCALVTWIKRRSSNEDPDERDLREARELLDSISKPKKHKW
ncbi:hypothetical protein OZX69_03580 [Lactobacillus sp. ESL0731]|uniref:hypothetical protein n=2 Tax=unclassified Lactobacillus TaxID=2620435 RepID=UPI0023F65F48|nr:hypothetical protein [Lactobacillus sp. ESL0731]WEV62920.1 hypothetical protein OZX69_03580 [Lactobacillus sp. ESL0731]